MLLKRDGSGGGTPPLLYCLPLVSSGITSIGRNPDEPSLVPVLDQGDFYAVANVTGSF